MSVMTEKIEKMLKGDSEMKALGRALLEEEKVKKSLHIELATRIQGAHPEIVIGGSLALYIHGIRLSRWREHGGSDLDMVSPYYINFGGEIVCDKSESCKKDFDMVIFLDGVNVDLKIDPRRRYETVELDGIDYRVTPLEIIWEAKCRYAVKGNSKHKSDLLEVCGKRIEREPKVEVKEQTFIYRGS